MHRWKVVVTDWEYEDLCFEEQVLQDEAFELIPAQCRTEEEVIAACRDADGIINQYAPISRRVIQSLDRCRVIARYGVGVNTIDLAAATEGGICVANVPNYCVDEVSDHALALLLNLMRKITCADRAVKKGVWDYKVTQPLYLLRGQTIGLVGFGKIPQRLAEKLKPIGFRVIAYDPYIPTEVADQKGVPLVSLERLCEEADGISVHAPLTHETRGLIGRAQFSAMKEGAVIVNTSRGPVIDEKALIEALEGGKLAGAALDVVEKEPITLGHRLLSMEQVILTPHLAWYSEEAASEMRIKAASAIRDVLLDGRYPTDLVNDSVTPRQSLRPSLSSKGVIQR